GWSAPWSSRGRATSSPRTRSASTAETRSAASRAPGAKCRERWPAPEPPPAAVRIRSGLVHPHPPDHRPLDGDVDEVPGVLLEGIAPEDDEVGALARLDRALPLLLEGRVRPVERPHADCLLDGDPLLRAPGRSLRVRPRDLGLERHHGLEGTGRVVRGLGRTHPGVEEAPEREHALE